MNEAGSVVQEVERQFPRSIEAECAVLGSAIIDNDILPSALEKLSPESFYKDAHRKIFVALVELYNVNKAIDLVTLSNHLKSKNQIEAVGGASYLSQLVDSVPSVSNSAHYVTIVWEKALLRRLLEISQYITNECMDATADLKEVIDTAEQQIFDISTTKQTSATVPFKELIKDSIETVERLYQNKSITSGTPTHFKDFDDITGGLHPSDMIVVAARPAMGKTSFVMNIMENVALMEKLPVAFFSLEMSKEQLALRMLCSHAHVSSQKVRRGFLAERDFPDLVNAAGKLAAASIFIDDTPNLSVLELRAKARRLKKLYDIKLIAIDYLQLMQPPVKRVENRQQEISQISRSIKALARELQVPIIVISQLNRAVESRTDHRPQLSDLRESGAIEQDADLVIMLLRRDYYDPDEEQGVTDVFVAKHRNGPVGDLKLRFFEEYTMFANYTARDEEV